jgi:hypothetical protein
LIQRFKAEKSARGGNAVQLRKIRRAR